MVPRVRTRKKRIVPLPHCPGDNQASLVINIVAAMPKADGLKMCLRLKRRIYFEITVRKAAINAV